MGWQTPTPLSTSGPDALKQRQADASLRDYFNGPAAYQTIAIVSGLETVNPWPLVVSDFLRKSLIDLTYARQFRWSAYITAVGGGISPTARMRLRWEDLAGGGASDFDTSTDIPVTAPGLIVSGWGNVPPLAQKLVVPQIWGLGNAAAAAVSFSSVAVMFTSSERNG